MAEYFPASMTPEYLPEVLPGKKVNLVRTAFTAKSDFVLERTMLEFQAQTASLEPPQERNIILATDYSALDKQQQIILRRLEEMQDNTATTLRWHFLEEQVFTLLHNTAVATGEIELHVGRLTDMLGNNDLQRSVLGPLSSEEDLRDILRLTARATACTLLVPPDLVPDFPKPPPRSVSYAYWKHPQRRLYIQCLEESLGLLEEE